MIGMKGFTISSTPAAKFDQTLPRRPGLIEASGTVVGRWEDDDAVFSKVPVVFSSDVTFWETMFVCSPRGKAYRKVGTVKGAEVLLHEDGGMTVTPPQAG